MIATARNLDALASLDFRAILRDGALSVLSSKEQDVIAADVEAVRSGGLHAFKKLAWSQLVPAPFIDSWHQAEIDNHLEAVSSGQILRLIINIPPGLTKSLTVSVTWPSWDWIDHGWRKFIFASYGALLSRRDALKMRNLITSPWFQARWPEVYIPRQNTRSAMYYTNNHQGFRFSTTVAGGVTGEHADVQVVDDPAKPIDLLGGGSTTRATLNANIDWWKGTMTSRITDPMKTARVIIMQRLHERDLSGEMARTGEYEVLRLPMRYEPKCHSFTSIGGDRRTVDGELLCPDRFPEEAVARMEREMGSMFAAAQLQQRPSPAGGGVFKGAWFKKRWRELPANLRLIQSWDMRFKDDKESGDYVVGQLWGTKGAEYYLVDQVRARAGFEDTCRMIADFSAKHPRALLKLVEDKANGPAVQNILKQRLHGIVLVNPEGGKQARANAIAPLLEAGNVWFPADAPWMNDFVGECESFPKGAHDDQVDSMSQALLRLSLNNPARYKQAMERVRAEGLLINRVSE